MEHHAEVLRGLRWYPRMPGWRDVAAVVLVFSTILLPGEGARQMTGPLTGGHGAAISLSPAALPACTLRTVLRMLIAPVASFIFTFTYATLAARSRRAERILIPLLDVLQSVPILGYLSFTVVFFMSLCAGNVLGAELASIFAIFTSQAWDMAFSFYQALRTVPSDLDEASRSFRLSGWQRFWRLEVPFPMPGLIWNAMMSMSGGWFFVVASEAISAGDVQVALPGMGSWVAQAITKRDLAPVGWAILAMSLASVLYDQLLFRPLVAWADRFRYGDIAAPACPRSWLLDLFHRSPWMQRACRPARSCAPHTCGCPPAHVGAASHGHSAPPRGARAMHSGSHCAPRPAPQPCRAICARRRRACGYGAWNASIVAETVNWGTTSLSAGGLGAYIAQMTARGDYPRIALGIAVMSIMVVAANRLIWRPLYAFAERRTRLA